MLVAARLHHAAALFMVVAAVVVLSTSSVHHVSLRCCCICWLQEKKAAEEARKKELAELFAAAIKQPKVPAGARHASQQPQQQLPCAAAELLQRVCSSDYQRAQCLAGARLCDGHSCGANTALWLLLAGIACVVAVSTTVCGHVGRAPSSIVCKS
jgi:hypothetical protein